MSELPSVTPVAPEPISSAHAPAAMKTPPHSAGMTASHPPLVTRVKLQPSTAQKDVKLKMPPMRVHMPAIAAAPSAGGDVSLEQTMLDSSLQNLWSLPEVVSQVAVQQRSHSQEIGSQRETLQQLESQLKEEKDVLEDLTHEIQALNRKVVSSQGLYSQRKKDVHQVQKELMCMIQVNTDLECQLDTQREKMKGFQEMVVATRKKMAAHCSATQRVVNGNPEELQRWKLLDEIEKLKSQKESGVLTCHTQPLFDAIKSKTAKREITSKEIQEKKAHLESLKMKQSDVRKETSVLHKRNAAQFRRLKSQVREIQHRQRQWSEEAARLETCISEIKQ